MDAERLLELVSLDTLVSIYRDLREYIGDREKGEPPDEVTARRLLLRVDEAARDLGMDDAADMAAAYESGALSSGRWPDNSRAGHLP